MLSDQGRLMFLPDLFRHLETLSRNLLKLSRKEGNRVEIDALRRAEEWFGAELTKAEAGFAALRRKQVSEVWKDSPREQSTLGGLANALGKKDAWGT
jgi:hypothetical protein